MAKERRTPEQLEAEYQKRLKAVSKKNQGFRKLVSRAIKRSLFFGKYKLLNKFNAENLLFPLLKQRFIYEGAKLSVRTIRAYANEINNAGWLKYDVNRRAPERVRRYSYTDEDGTRNTVYKTVTYPSTIILKDVVYKDGRNPKQLLQYQGSLNWLRRVSSFQGDPSSLFSWLSKNIILYIVQFLANATPQLIPTPWEIRAKRIAQQVIYSAAHHFKPQQPECTGEVYMSADYKQKAMAKIAKIAGASKKIYSHMTEEILIYQLSQDLAPYIVLCKPSRRPEHVAADRPCLRIRNGFFEGDDEQNQMQKGNSERLSHDSYGQ